MNKKRTTLGIGIVLALLVLTVSTASAYITIYLDPQDSDVPGYGDTTEVKVMADITGGDNLWLGQFNIQYDQSCCDITDLTWGEHVFPGMSAWNPPGYPECWGYGQDHIRYYFWPEQTGLVEICTFTFQGNSTGYCKTDLTFPYVGGSCKTQVRNATNDKLYPWNAALVEGTFACGTPLPPQTFEKELVMGWNLISLPLHNETDMTVANIIDESLSGSYDELYKYDASTPSFVSLSSTNTMENGVGYFINMTVAGTWSYSGEPCESIEIILSQGLNCVGWINETGSALPDALNSIEGKYNYVARWDATDPKYEVYDANAPSGVPEFIDFETMERGNGYWIAAKEGCTLSASCL